MTQLSAMKSAGVGVAECDTDAMTVTFDNGVTLPVYGFYDADGNETVDPVDGGYAEFGDDEHGHGTYPIKLISEEEYERQRARTAAARAQSTPPARQN